MGLNLHRNKKVPDWKLVPEKEWNTDQVIANATFGIATRGNGVSAAGVGLVHLGRNQIRKGRSKTGIAFMVGGFLCDLGDGWISDRKGTKSRLGAVIDVVCDFEKLAVTLPTMKEADMIPDYTYYWMATQKTINALATGTASLQGKDTFVDAEGKYFTLMQGGVLLLHSISSELEKADSEYAPALKIITALGEAACFGMGLAASKGYIQRVIEPEVQPEFVYQGSDVALSSW